jgi:uncharacterized membrane protein
MQGMAEVSEGCYTALNGLFPCTVAWDGDMDNKPLSCCAFMGATIEHCGGDTVSGTVAFIIEAVGGAFGPLKSAQWISLLNACPRT